MAKTIIIIEDEQYLSEMYKIKFEQKNYQIIIANDGMKGIELAKQKQPDLILLDIVLPKMDGYQVLQELKKDEKTKNLKVYVLSNLGQNNEINKAFKHGADGYLIKSDLTPSQLLDKVKQALNGKVVGIKRKKFDLPDKISGVIQENNKIKPVAKILLIEDEEAIINMYKLRFEKANFAIEVANNGAWGLKLARQKPFDIIIMDMVMPAVNGYNAIKQLKRDKKTKNIPIIVLSNSAQENEIDKAKKLGAECYLLKSQITPSKLVKETKKILKKL